MSNDPTTTRTRPRRHVPSKWLRLPSAMLVAVVIAGVLYTSALALKTIHLENTPVTAGAKCVAGKEDEWHFIINQVGGVANKPASISVFFQIGGVPYAGNPVTVPLEAGVGGPNAAHYTLLAVGTHAALASATVTDGTASIFDAWDGQFIVSHTPCRVPTSITTTLHNADHGAIAEGTTLNNGTVIHDSATVTSTTTPTGTVSFRLYERLGAACNPATDTLVAAYNGGTGVSTIGPTSTTATTATYDPSADIPGSLPGGNYYFLATFNGDATHLTSTANCEPFRIKDPPGASLSLSKTANGTFDSVCKWTIDKSVKPGVIDMFVGDSADATYTVDLTRTCENTSFKVDGKITVNNDSTLDSYTITDVSDAIGLGNSATGPVVFTNCALPATVLPGGTFTCDYSVPVATSGAGTNTATVKADGINLSYTTTIGWSGPVNTTNASVTVTDPNDPNSPRTVTGTGSFSYTKTFTCGESKKYDNTATIKETGQSDDASVLVNCYKLDVSKDVKLQYDVDWDWTIEKAADKDSVVVTQDGSASVGYTVTMTPKSTKTNVLKATGTITVHNPAPIPATVNSVSDALTAGTAVVTCPGGPGPYTIAPGGDLPCTYVATLTNDAPQTNTATAALQNAPTGTTSFSGTAAVDFSNATLRNETDKCVTVDDDKAGPQGTHCAGSGPVVIKYNQTIKSDGTCKAQEFPNTASFTTSDQDGENDDTGSASATVKVEKLCIKVTKTAVPSHDRECSWTIEKTVSPEKLLLTQTGSGDVDYTIVITPDCQDINFKVEGTITVKNVGTAAADVTSVTDQLSDGSSAVVTCVPALPQALAPDASLTCGYTVTPASGKPGTNTASATATAGSLGVTETGSATYDFTGAPVNVYGDKPVVTDSMTDPLPAPVNNVIKYSKKLESDGTCKQQTVENIATVTWGTAAGGSASAKDDAIVTLDKLCVTISKTAETSYTRTCKWDVDKKADPTQTTVVPGTEVAINYTVDVTVECQDSAYTVSGNIKVTNTGSVPVDIVVTDILDATVTCPDTSLDPGQVVVCTYSGTVATTADGTNKATVEATAVGLTVTETAEANYSFGPPDKTTNACVTTSDTNSPVPSGTLCAKDLIPGGGAGSGSQQYTYTVKVQTDPASCKAQEVNNTVKLVGDNDEELDSASTTTRIDKLCVTISKTADATYTRTCKWDVDKKADPTQTTVLPGTEVAINYTVDVTVKCEDSAYTVSGKIEVTNTGSVPITISVTDLLPATVTCLDTSLDPGDVVVCTYSGTVPTTDPGTNVAKVEATAGGLTITEMATRGYTFGPPDKTTNACVAISDTNTDGPNETLCDKDLIPGGGAGAGSKQYTYAVKVQTDPKSCEAEKVENIVKLVGDNDEELDSASTTTRIDKLCVTITKTADARYTRTCKWDVDKKADPTQTTVLPGTEVAINYTVDVKVECEDSPYTVSGDITVTNTGSVPIVIDVTDILDATVTCPDTSLDPGQVVVCSYSGTVATPAGGINEAKVEAKADGLTVTETATAPYTFGEPPTTNACVIISDTNPDGPNDKLCAKFLIDGGGAGTGSKTYEYIVKVQAPADSCKTQEVGNTVKLVGDNGEELDTASTTTRIDKLCIKVEKTATLTYDRVCKPTLTKTADPAGPLTVSAGGTVTINWTVVASIDCTNENGKLTGKITITNLGSAIPTSYLITESIPGAVVTCDPIQANGNQDCTYAASVPVADGKNEVKVSATVDGATATATAEAAYTVDNHSAGCWALTDANVPEIAGKLCDDGKTAHQELKDTGTTTKSYPVGCVKDTITNKAVLTADDGSTTTATASVEVIVPCIKGKTQGFWGNQNGNALITSKGLLPQTLKWKLGSFTVTTLVQSNTILPNIKNFCSLVNCSGLDSGVSSNDVNNLASQTLALSYNVANFGAAYSSQTLGAMGCTVPVGPLTATSTVADALAYANSLLNNVGSGGIVVTKNQIGAVNGLLGGCVNIEN